MKTHPFDPEGTFAVDVGDLRLCLRHNLPVNRCIECWYEYLKHLGRSCFEQILLARGKVVRGRRELEIQS
jgi:hypothetical protein